MHTQFEVLEHKHSQKEVESFFFGLATQMAEMSLLLGKMEFNFSRNSVSLQFLLSCVYKKV